MKLYSLSILVLLLFFKCSTDVDVQTAEMQQPLTDVCTLELTFGNNEENLPSEYLLISPSSITVSDNNDIFVEDETSIKVYNSNGRPKTIIGGKGEGPGEFSNIFGISIGPSGILLVREEQYSSIFTPDYKFISKIDFRYSRLRASIQEEYKWESINLSEVLYLSEDGRIALIRGGTHLYNSDPSHYYVLIHEKHDSLKSIVHHSIEYEFSYYRRIGGAGYGARYTLDFLSKFLWSYVSGGKIIYVKTSEDVINNNSESYYTLHVFSLHDGQEKEIIQRYTRIPVSDEQIRYFNEEAAFNPKIKDLRNLIDRIINTIEDKKYNASLQSLKADRNYIFAFTYKMNSKKEIIADVFDIDAGEYLVSAYFPKIPRIIKNGYAYYLIRGTDENFPKIEKYRIDPAVYGK